MKIRTQTIYAFVPLFLFVSGAVGALQYQISKNDMLWGLNEEAGALAVATAAHLDGERIEGFLRTDSTDSLADNELVLRRILSWGVAQKVSIYGSDGKKALLLSETAIGNNPAIPPARHDSLLDGATQSAAKGEPYFVSPVLEEGKRGEHIVAYAPVFDARGSAAAFVEVLIDAGTYSQTLQNILVQSIWNSAALLLVGIALALLLARIINSKISQLTAGVKSLVTGSSQPLTGENSIQEIDDLANTFSTMKSILDDNAARLENIPVESRLSRKNTDIVETYNELVSGTREFRFLLEDHIVEISGMLPDIGDYQNFYEVFGRGDALFIVLGKLEKCDVDEAVRERSALQYLCHQELRNGNSPEQIFRKLSELFFLERWRCAEIRRHQNQRTLSCILHAVDIPEDIVSIQKRDLTDGSSFFLCSSPHEPYHSKVLKYLKKIPSKDATFIRNEIMPILSFESQGAAVVIGVVAGEMK